MSFYISFRTPSVLILCPFNTYGLHQSARAVIPVIITQIANVQRQIKLGITPPDFNYVGYTVSGFIAALESDRGVVKVVNNGRIFEISIGETV